MFLNQKPLKKANKEIKNWPKIFTIHVVKGLIKKRLYQEYIKYIFTTMKTNNPKRNLGKRCEKSFYKRDRRC